MEIYEPAIQIGGSALIPVDVRIIAATNRDLVAAIDKGEFRQDLYFRLRVLVLRIPALRERPEDIPILFKYFAGLFCHKIGLQLDAFSLDNIDFLINYSWPGNVRELVNLCEQFVALAGCEPDPGRLLQRLFEEVRREYSSAGNLAMNGDNLSNWQVSWHKLEGAILEKMLAESGLTKAAFAQSVGLSRAGLWKKISRRSRGSN